MSDKLTEEDIEIVLRYLEHVQIRELEVKEQIALIHLSNRLHGIKNNIKRLKEAEK